MILLSVFLPFVLGGLSLLIPEKKTVLRQLLTLSGTLAVLCLAAANLFSQGSAQVLSFGFSLTGFQAVYGFVTAFMWFGAALLSPAYFKGHHDLKRYFFFFLLTLGATMGVFYSSDLMTTFIFFELMSFTSYTWVVQEKNSQALSAGKTYLTVAVFGGMVCLMGLFMLQDIAGTLSFEQLGEFFSKNEKTPAVYAAFCMLTGFGAKAGLFPMHIWLPKAHPVAPAPASALLSGVLTKTGIFGMLVITAKILPEDEIWGYTLLLLGSITMVLGAAIAVFSMNLKRTLACSSLSQIGFITVGVSMLCLLGEENSLAANGTVLYMLNHSLVKLILFLCAGAVYMGAHTLDLNRLRGYGRGKILLMIPFLIGGCSLAGIPGTSGYIAKTLVHESIVEYAHHHGALITAVEWLFLFSGGLTAAYVLKLFITIFVMKPTQDTPAAKKLSPLSAVSLLMGTVPVLTVGLLPHKAGEKLSEMMISFAGGHRMHHAVEYFAWVNLKGVVISLSIGCAVYFLFISKVLMKGEKGQRVHINPLENRFSAEENLYKPLYRLIMKLMGAVAWLLDSITEYAVKVSLVVMGVAAKLLSDFTDLMIVLLSKTLLRTHVQQHDDMPRHFSYALGEFIDRHQHGKNHTKKKDESMADLFASVSETISQTTARLSGSFSFALLMTCFGICLILLFLLLVN